MSDSTPSSPPPSPPRPPFPPLPPAPAPTPPAADRNIVRDVFQWRRKMLSIIVLLTATTTWVVLKVYNYNFIPIACYVGMAISASLYAWASILRLMGKGTPRLSGVEISEERAVEMGNSVKEMIEEGIRWMFRVGAEGDLYVFGGSVAAFWLFSYIGRFTDLLTFLYIGIVVGVIVPPIYMKYEYKIKEYRNRTRVQCERLYNIINERVVKKVKNMVVGDQKREKKGKKIE